jgi:hypothetical protein
LRSAQRGGVAEQQVVAVGLVQQGVELEDQLTDGGLTRSVLTDAAAFSAAR